MSITPESWWYATEQDYIEYNDRYVDLRLLARANEYIKQLVARSYDPRREDHVMATKQAVLATVTSWETVGEPSGQPIVQYSAGKVSVTFRGGSAGSSYLPPTARMYLLKAGLLYQPVIPI